MVCYESSSASQCFFNDAADRSNDVLQGDKDPATSGRMNLTQFKALWTAARALTGRLTVDKLDDIFTAVAASPAALERKLDATASSTMTFADFLVSVAHVAYHRFAAMVRFELLCRTHAHPACDVHLHTDTTAERFFDQPQYLISMFER